MQEDNIEKLDVMQAPKRICTLAAEDLKKEIPSFRLLHVFRKSEYPADSYLYVVVGQKKDGTYASWVYNVSTGSFNLGHYDFTSHIECIKDVINNRITYL